MIMYICIIISTVQYVRWSRVYSMMVYQPLAEEAALIYHLDGRKYKTDQQRRELGWGRNAGAGAENEMDKGNDKT